MDRSLSRRAWFGVAGAATVATLAACGSTKTSSAPTVTVTVPESPTIPTESPRPVITDPQVALDRLMAGNQRFVDAQMQHPDQDPEHRLKLSQGQQPFATILTCSDSRLPPELLFDQGLGDLFVARVAGNIVDPALLGSVEYAVGHLGTPLIVVIGHEKCGAVAGDPGIDPAPPDATRGHRRPGHRDHPCCRGGRTASWGSAGQYDPRQCRAIAGRDQKIVRADRSAGFRPAQGDRRLLQHRRRPHQPDLARKLCRCRC